MLRRSDPVVNKLIAKGNIPLSPEQEAALVEAFRDELDAARDILIDEANEAGYAFSSEAPYVVDDEVVGVVRIGMFLSPRLKDISSQKPAKVLLSDGEVIVTDPALFEVATLYVRLPDEPIDNEVSVIHLECNGISSKYRLVGYQHYIPTDAQYLLETFATVRQQIAEAN